MSARVLACAALALAAGAGGCAAWHAAEQVAPAVTGELLGEHAAFRGAVVERSVRHHDNPGLGASDVALVAADGSFDFPPLSLDVVAQEFSKTWVLTLSTAMDGASRVLYREEYSRLALGERRRLICDLASADALPCRLAP